ncbi:uncharacterized protein LOC126758153 [Bactrocera neohumeralis]|uniref:uncharacterized protein LOC126758153 n=1 Tax=Bactrocera neohumeralis TaxID=98809 RepID=UPI00216544F6|nr:uncharacterized protein LOC126758153 [Bactrocera neohumeralis]
MATRLFETTPTLYKLCINSFLDNLQLKQLTSRQLEFMPIALVADILIHMARVDRLKVLVLKPLSKPFILDGLLRHENTTSKLLMCMGLVEDRIPVYVKKVVENFILHSKNPVGQYPDLIDFGLRLGSFLSDVGWMLESIQIFNVVEAEIRLQGDSESVTIQLVDCLQRRLHCETLIWEFKAGRATIAELSILLRSIDFENVPKYLAVEIYTRSTEFHLVQHKIKEGYRCSAVIMQYISESMPKSTLVDALRVTAKACFAIRKFGLANVLIQQAISMAATVFGRNHLIYADVLFDYAYFLLLFDKPQHAINIYDEVRKIRNRKLCDQSFLISLTDVAFANACYVRKHRSLRLIQNALRVLTRMLPIKNLLLASTLRLHLLIKHQISTDKYARFHRNCFLEFGKLVKIQTENVNICLDVHDDKNLFTAKNYFELARIYQAGKNYQHGKRYIAMCILVTKKGMGSSKKEIDDLHVLEGYLKKTNEERDIIQKVKLEPWLLNRIETFDPAHEVKKPLSARFHGGLTRLYPPHKNFQKFLINLATIYNSKTENSQQNVDFWCIRFLQLIYFTGMAELQLCKLQSEPSLDIEPDRETEGQSTDSDLY